MQEITLTLTLAEINQILASLGNQPYKEVFELVNKVQQQAQRQLKRAENSLPAAASEQ